MELHKKCMMVCLQHLLLLLLLLFPYSGRLRSCLHPECCHMVVMAGQASLLRQHKHAVCIYELTNTQVSVYLHVLLIHL